MKDRYFNEYEEINELCLSLESIPGIKVSQASVISKAIGDGPHQRDNIYVWFKVYDQKLLFPVARGVNRRYGCIQFNLFVDVDDNSNGDCVTYELVSKMNNLDKNLIEASKLSYFIRHYMNQENLIQFSGMDKVIGKYKTEHRDKVVNDILDHE